MSHDRTHVENLLGEVKEEIQSVAHVEDFIRGKGRKWGENGGLWR